MRRTKIVATLGPASDPPETVAALLDAGADVFRLGLAHGTPEEHLARIERIRSVADERDRKVAVLCDLPGPKVRAGTFPEGGAFLAEGDEVELVAGDGPSDADRITVDEDGLTGVAGVGDTVVLGDGTVTLEVRAVDDEAVRAVVRSGGRLQGRPGVHLPSERWAPAVPTDHDLALVDRVARQADWVAVSFVRRADEIERVREALGADGPKVMAKIETRAAVDHLDELLDAADGVMVARGDLGIDCAIEEVPQLQKRIIRAAARRGVPVVTATQMLESMVTAPAPTRAEVSDVANAVVDGTDALMLSAETAIGQHPVAAVRTMGRIALRAEQSDERLIAPEDRGRLRRREITPEATAVAMAHAALRAASELHLSAIVCCTRSGTTARAMAALRPACRLIGASPSPATARQLALTWGVEPLEVGEYGSTDDMVWCVVEATVRRGLVKAGQSIAVLAGAPGSPAHGTDVLRIVTVQ
ncbi:MAG TPA: pyruvate kinase [Acidimicrobiales bacterium]